MSKPHDFTVNYYLGCRENCLYCYSRILAMRFERIEKHDDWKHPAPLPKEINKKCGLRNGRITVPYSHNISTEEQYNIVLPAFKRLLSAGNRLLITLKPRYTIIKRMVENLADFIDTVHFRFTITTIDDQIRRTWEPDAPIIQERLDALKLARQKGFWTSVSIEPFLDDDPLPLIRLLEKSNSVSESIWLGPMNHLEKIQQYLPDSMRDEAARIRRLISPDNLADLYSKINPLKIPLLKFRNEEKWKMRLMLRV